MNRQLSKWIATELWRVTGAALVVLALAAPLPLSAQSRAEELRQRRQAKSGTLQAPGRGGLESGLYKFENQRFLVEAGLAKE